MCCDPLRNVRHMAISYLQRALLAHDLQRLSPNEWEACFLEVRGTFWGGEGVLGLGRGGFEKVAAVIQMIVEYLEGGGGGGSKGGRCWMRYAGGGGVTCV